MSYEGCKEGGSPDRHGQLPPGAARRVDSRFVAAGVGSRVDPRSADIIGQISKDVPQILINRELVAKPHEFDVYLEGDCDTHVRELCGRLNWTLPTVETVRANPVSPRARAEAKGSRADSTESAIGRETTEEGKAKEQDMAASVNGL